MAHESFHFLKRKINSGGKGLALKLDMNDAYDIVKWCFLYDTLVSFSFDQGWISRILTLVTTASLKLSVILWLLLLLSSGGALMAILEVFTGRAKTISVVQRL